MTRDLRVWATRPEAQNIEWCKALRDQGFDVVNLPLLGIEPVSQLENIQAVKNRVLAFDEYQKVIFVSQNAVKEAFRWVEDFWPQIPIGIQYFAVGEKTAEAVVDRGVDVVACTSAMNSDELLTLTELTDVQNQKILICRGVGGLPRLGEELKSRGAFVEYCELYERVMPATASAEAENYLNTLGARDAVVLFSGETLQNFVSVLQANNCEKRDILLVVPGERVAEMAKSLGFSRVVAAENASANAMLLTLVSIS